MILSFSILYYNLFLYLLQGLIKKVITTCMALTLNSPPPSNLSWVRSLFVGPLTVDNSHDDHNHHEHDIKNIEAHKEEEEDINLHRLYHRENIHNGARSEKLRLIGIATMKENEGLEINYNNQCYLLSDNKGSVSSDGGDCKAKEAASCRLRKRPSRLVVPEYLAGQEFCENGRTRKFENEEVEVEGRDFSLVAKKGMRMSMEDGYGVLLDIMGDPKQAFFAVMDGHGGCAATDYVAENLGKNIVKGVEHIPTNRDEDKVEEAIRKGYLVTDKEFLSQGVSSGACAASVLLKNGNLHVANVGDCRVVLSRKGVADVLTNDHRLTTREDERLRIENSGGFVHCRNGVWRVQGSLAVSRAIGDQHLKEWVISEPEIKTLPLTSDCEFFIVASDGLWDKEAVDIVLRENSILKACKKLVDMSSSRGNMDDITVMVVNLHNFVQI
ncbi:probable protein phosphatase 2C 2 isoform X2 [Humulus lupulus]|uniref:probable protein phosphatase 2C 2 isoform X2 n=1 Tax=Humulus lupulus TaxID=3486 RepID=UPI002B40C136|nr:probable protein phosphatase 2C 2 isoform X2 [Humulus lupulus]